MSFPILLEHRDAVGQLGTQRVRASVLAAIGPALVARGADKLLVPVPGSLEFDRASEGLEEIPAERRRLVRLIDRDAEVLRRVREYLLPLRHQASKWPETAFASFAETFLYRAALAAKHRAGVAHDSIQPLRELVPLVDPSVFSGEARFRLADIISVICSYQPVSPDYPAFSERKDVANIGRTVWQVMQTGEFNALVAESGKLGLLRDPWLSLAILRDRVIELVSMPGTRGLLTAGQTAADFAGAGGAADSLGRVAEFLSSGVVAHFRPPFFHLGPSLLTIYRVALEETFPGAQPPEGTIMVFEETRAGGTSTSWLRTGEEGKLTKEQAEGPARRQERWREALAARDRFYR